MYWGLGPGTNVSYAVGWLMMKWLLYLDTFLFLWRITRVISVAEAFYWIYSIIYLAVNLLTGIIYFHQIAFSLLALFLPSITSSMHRHLLTSRFSLQYVSFLGERDIDGQWKRAHMVTVEWQRLKNFSRSTRIILIAPSFFPTPTIVCCSGGNVDQIMGNASHWLITNMNKTPFWSLFNFSTADAALSYLAIPSLVNDVACRAAIIFNSANVRALVNTMS